MKILYIHQYFKTPLEGGAVRSYYLAKGLVDNGHEVEMITSHNENFAITKNIDGIKVHYLPVPYDNSFGFIRRIWSFYQFYRKALSLALTIDKVDYCYATSTPLTVGLVSLGLLKRKGIPYVFEVRDLWPEAPIQLGAIKSWWLKKQLYRMERDIYEHADKLVALSPGIRDGIERIVPNKHISLIPNMSDTDYFRKEAKKKVLIEKYAVKGKFVISYFGAIGKVNKLEYLIQMAELAQDKAKSFVFLIIGKGYALRGIKKLVENKGLTNVRFLPYQTKEGLRDILNITDATYISFADAPVLETNSPNKLFDSLAAGKLCIVNKRGWMKEILESNEAGIYANPSHPHLALKKLKTISKQPMIVDYYQSNARSIAEAFYSRELQVQKLLKLMDPNHVMVIKNVPVYTLTA
jgi:glycosyltransferase involved in cell wall biosynthesis